MDNMQVAEGLQSKPQGGFATNRDWDAWHNLVEGNATLGPYYRNGDIVFDWLQSIWGDSVPYL